MLSSMAPITSLSAIPPTDRGNGDDISVLRHRTRDHCERSCVTSLVTVPVNIRHLRACLLSLA